MRSEKCLVDFMILITIFEETLVAHDIMFALCLAVIYIYILFGKRASVLAGNHHDTERAHDRHMEKCLCVGCQTAR